MISQFLAISLIAVFLVSALAGCEKLDIKNPTKQRDISRFKSGQELLDAFEEARKTNQGGYGILESAVAVGMVKTTAIAQEASAPAADSAGRDFSTTNIQVEGVDEADIIKTDGNYIYIIAQNQLIIAKAYPAESAKIVSTTKFNNFYPNELFIYKDRLVVFGQSNYELKTEQAEPSAPGAARISSYYNYMSATSVKIYDISDKSEPELLKTHDFEGNYLTSRMIGRHVYFVINTYPRWYDSTPKLCEDIIPLYRETDGNSKPEEAKPIARCTDIGYIEPIQAENFITVASIDVADEDAEIQKEVIVGSGQNVYASLKNLYVAQTTWPNYYEIVGGLKKENIQKTIITRFELDNGKIEFAGKGEVKGHILNQFSMDEYDKHFRIATTIGEVWNSERKSTNNVYVLDEDMKVVGSLEDLAPGEKIYSVRFMGKRGYMVTFKKIDPLFVIDLSVPTNPSVLGKLKIPGYSDYLHPYDENHIIGIGKEAVDAESELIEQRNLDFAWYQGVKMAIFDVSDVEHPIELHKVVIGDRGTDSEALHNHKAFLFDKEKELMVLPITLAEIKGERTSPTEYGEFTFQGAYVYNINLDDGFKLRGRVSHYDTDDVYKKSGYYFSGYSSIRRSLYIDDILYTMSDSRLQLNDLDSLEKLKALEFEKEENPVVVYTE